jgi:hypothetical protein
LDPSAKEKQETPKTESIIKLKLNEQWIKVFACHKFRHFAQLDKLDKKSSVIPHLNS